MLGQTPEQGPGSAPERAISTGYAGTKSWVCRDNFEGMPGQYAGTLPL